MIRANRLVLVVSLVGVLIAPAILATSPTAPGKARIALPGDAPAEPLRGVRSAGGALTRSARGVQPAPSATTGSGSTAARTDPIEFGGAPAPKLSGGGAVGLIGTTNDGLTAVWTEDVGGGVFEIFQRPIDGSGPAIPLTAGLGLTAFGIPEAQVTPDDAAIVFMADDGSGADVWSVPVGGGTALKLVGSFVSPATIGITPDSSTVFFLGLDVVNSTGVRELWRATIGSAGSATQMTAMGFGFGAPTGVLFATPTPDSSTLVFASDTGAGTQFDFFSIPIGSPFSVTQESFTASAGVAFIRTAPGSSTMYFTADQSVGGLREVHKTTIGSGGGGTVMNTPMAAAGIGAEWIELSNDGSRLGYAGERDVAGATGAYTVATSGPFPDPGVSLSPFGVDAASFVNFNINASIAVWETAEVIAGEFELYGAPADGSAPPYLLHDVTDSSGDTLGFFTGSGVPTANERTFYPLFVAAAPPIELYSVRADGTEPFKQVNAPYAAGDSAWSAWLPGIGQRLAAILTGPISAGGTSADRIQVGPLRADLPVEQANPTADLVGGETGIFDFQIAPTENHLIFTQDADTPGLAELYVFTPDSDADGTPNPADSCKFVSQVGQAPVPFPVSPVLAVDGDTFDWMDYLDVAYVKGVFPVTAAYTTTETGSLFDARSFVDEDDPTAGTGCWYLFKVDCPGGDWGSAARNAALP